MRAHHWHRINPKTRILGVTYRPGDGLHLCFWWVVFSLRAIHGDEPPGE